jgi:hypothetical protein
MTRFKFAALVVLLPAAFALLGMDGCSFTDTEYVTVGSGGASSGGTSSGDCCGCDGAYFGDDWLWEEQDQHWALHWWTYNQWDGGACVGMVMCNYGPEDYNWEMTLKVSPGVRDVSFFSGAWMDFEGTTINISPMCGDELPCGNAQEMNFCAEPQVELTKFFIEAEEVVYDDDDDDDDDDDPAPYNPGSLQDEDCHVGLMYSHQGESGGGECLQMEYVNLGDDTVTIDSIQLGFTGPLVVTDHWNVWYEVTGNYLDLDLLYYNELQPAATHVSTVCIEDMVSDQIRPFSLDVDCS